MDPGTKRTRSAPAGHGSSGVATPARIRVAPALPLLAVLRELGVDPDGVFARSGIGAADLADPDQLVGFDSIGRMVGDAIEATGCEHLGLLIGQRFSPATIGPVFQLMKHSSSLREAIRCYVHHLHLHDLGGVGYVLGGSHREVGLAYGICRHGDFDVAPLYDTSMAVGIFLLRELCGPRFHPIRVMLSRRRPADIVPYRRILGPSLVFDAEHSAIVFDERWLDEPIQGSDPALRAAFERLVAEKESAEALGLPDRVRRVLRSAILAGSASADRIAFMFGMSRRSLHRQLQAEGTGLQVLVNETRFAVARQLLADSDMPAGEIASVLRYADASAFSRAFRDWSGSPPREWRQAVRKARNGSATGSVSATRRRAGTPR